MKITYRCEFEFVGELKVVYSEDGLADFRDGFWVDATFKFTRGSNCKFWIPPSRLLYIAKDTINS